MCCGLLLSLVIGNIGDPLSLLCEQRCPALKTITKMMCERRPGNGDYDSSESLSSGSLEGSMPFVEEIDHREIELYEVNKLATFNV